MIALANNTGMDGLYLLESIGGKDWNGLAKRMEYAIIAKNIKIPKIAWLDTLREVQNHAR